MKTPREIIDIWPSRAALARDLGLKPVVVQRWYARNSIPPRYDMRILMAAKGKGKTLSLYDFASARTS